VSAPADPRGTLIAVTRRPSERLADCELTHLVREPIDILRALDQHAAYRHCLEQLGCRVVDLPADPEYPDGVFVEDTALVLDEVAILARPGAPARRGEVSALEPVLAEYREVRRLDAPAQLDGGDVLPLGRTLYVGISARTSRSGCAALAALVEPFGYTVEPVEVSGCLHLKTAISAVEENALLVNPQWVDVAPFRHLELIEIDRREPFAANVLRLGDRILAAAEHRHTLDRLVGRGLEITAIDLGELAKAEAGPTCCSIVFETRPGRGDSGPDAVPSHTLRP
jgi:dimethylargininase